MKFLPDVAVTKDSLGGFHGGLSKVLRKIVEECSQSLSICLVGQKGSGKSTVLEIFKRAIPSSKFFTITYDAWTHQHDQPRRSFLVVCFSESEKFLSGKSKCFDAQFRNLLDGKRFLRVENNFKFFSFFIIAYAVLIFFFQDAISGQLLSPFDHKKSFDSVAFLFSSLIIMAPGLLYFFPMSRSGVVEHLGKILNFTIDSGAQGASVDIEQRDFSKYFLCLCQQYKALGLRPVFIVDNLDRIDDPQFAENILSQIKSIYDLACESKSTAPIFICSVTPEMCYKDGDQSVDREKYFDVLLEAINLDVLREGIKGKFVNDFSEIVVDQTGLNLIPEIAWQAYVSEDSTYSKSPRGASRYINDFYAFILFLQEADKVGGFDLEACAFRLGDKENTSVLAMKIAIRNTRNTQSDEFLHRICWQPEAFSTLYKRMFNHPPHKNISELQSVYSQYEAASTNTYRLFVRHQDVKLRIDIREVFEGVNFKTYDYLYRHIFRHDYCLRAFLEYLKLPDFSKFDLRYIKFAARLFFVARDFQEVVRSIHGADNTDAMGADVLRSCSRLQNLMWGRVNHIGDVSNDDLGIIAEALRLKDERIPYGDDDCFCDDHGQPRSLYYYLCVGIILRVMQTHAQISANSPDADVYNNPIFLPLLEIFSNLCRVSGFVDLFVSVALSLDDRRGPAFPDVSKVILEIWQHPFTPYPAMTYSGFVRGFVRGAIVNHKNSFENYALVKLKELVDKLY